MSSNNTKSSNFWARCNQKQGIAPVTSTSTMTSQVFQVSHKPSAVGQTTVSNVRSNCIRPAYRSLKEWIDDPKNIYIGRAGPVSAQGVSFPKASLWGNPFKVGRDGTLDDVLRKFNAYVRERIEREDLESELDALRNHNLGCWCVPETCCYEVNQNVVCHGQILLRILHEREQLKT